MARKTFYLPKDDAHRAEWLTTFAQTLPDYQAALGLAAADVAAVQADAKFFAYVLRAQAQALAFSATWTAYKNAVRDGGPGDYSLLPALVAVPGTPPPPVPAGIIGRVRALVARIKTMPGYTENIGVGLQIIGSEPNLDLQSLQPELTAWADSGRVRLGWTKQGMDGVELWVDRGGGFVYLAISTLTEYADPQPLPTAGQAALWKYKAIYRKADQHVGRWSAITSLAVAG